MNTETKLRLGPTRLNLVHPTGVTENEVGQLVVGGKEIPKIMVQASFNVESGLFEIRYEVESNEPPFVNENLAKGSSAEGLWNWDVVEVFLQPYVSDPTYYEFVMSPLGQHFELEIFEPRRRTNPAFRSGAKIAAGLSPNGWWAELKCEVKNLRKVRGWNLQSGRLKAGFFAILGNPEQKPGRSYWSLNLPQQTVPDFHRPEYFIALD